MRAARFIALIGLLAAVGGGLALGANSANRQANQTMEPGELYAAGTAAYHRSEYAAAIGYLGQYLDARAASVGDPRLAEVQRMFADCAMMLARQQVRNHLEMAAAVFLVRSAGHVGVGDSNAAEMKSAAQKDLQEAETAAEKKPDQEQILELAAMWVHLFPSAPPLLDKSQLRQHRLAELTQLSKMGRPDVALKLIAQLKADGTGDDAIAAAGVNTGDLVLKYAQALFDRGWFRQAAWECQNLGSLASPTIDQTTKANKLTERSLAGYIKACQQFGNGPMIKEAVDLYTSDTNPARDPTKVHRYRAIADQLKEKDQPQSLMIAGKCAEGKGVWLATGTGFQLDKNIQIGNDRGNHGGDDVRGEIDVQPGFTLRGGTITVSSLGSLKFDGTPAKPIILKGVTFNCDLNGSVTANWTIFIKCRFQKSGHLFTMLYSSKWNFSDCTLVQSDFAGLNRTDYGIKWNNLTFVDCRLPDRILTSPRDDAAQWYHDTWNKMGVCTFYDCGINPSALWGAMPAICYGCDVNGTACFYSKTSMTVPVAMLPGDGYFLAQLITNTTTGGTGDLQYTSGAPPATKPTTPWQLLPELAQSPPR